MFDSLDKKIYLINIIALLLFSFIIISLLCVNLKNQKDYLIKDAQNQTENVSRFVLSDLERFIFGAEELMEGMHNTEEHIENNPEHDEHIDNMLFQNMREHIMDILIINEEAQIIHWTQKNKKKPNVATREYVKFHLNQIQPNNTFIGKPKLSKVHKGKWFFPVSKAFYKKGKLQNIIVMIIDLDFFNKRYKKHLINSKGTIFLASTSGEMYARYPYNYNFIGRKLKEIKDFASENIEKKYFDIPSPLDKKERIATLVKSNIYPIVAGSSVLTQSALEEWQKQKQNTLVIAILIVLGFIILVIYYTKLQNKLITLSQRDSLTKLLNRGYFLKQAVNEFKRAKRNNSTFSVLMLDIDNFKNINDNYGHHKGDKVIKKLADIIISNTRDIDSSGRYGGEEFIILLTDTNCDNAINVATRIKDSFENDKIKNLPNTTVSIGISQYKEDDKILESIIKRADKLMYKSKKDGKNRISI